ncbi:MAG TPA: hypothetical protein VFK57_02185 [Vicinamibacterales bacterium]|nr:hypothetical protein [Vicinamibacterales bacterium]
MLIKIHGGTRVQEAQNLCERCRCARIVRGRRLDEEIVFCSAMAMEAVRIDFKVTSCTDYVDATTPSYQELVEKAWILAPKTKRRPAGFVRGSDLEPEELMHFLREPGRRE